MTVDARPGFNCGCQTRGYTHTTGARWRPYAGVIERKWVSFGPIEHRKFRTEAEATAWVAERLRQLDEWEEDRDWKEVQI